MIAELESFGHYYQHPLAGKGSAPKNNTPNKNIVIIDNILGWSSEIDKGLEALRIEAKTTDQKYAVSEAVEQIEMFLRVDVDKLRKAFE